MSLFDFFRREKPANVPRLDYLESKVRILEDLIEKQSRTLKGLEAEWEQMYDKLSHLMARITKRRAALEREQQQATEAASLPLEQTSPVAGGSHRVIGTHDDLQEMRRRNGLLPR